MLKALLVFFITCLFGMPTLAEEGEMLKIKMTFNDQTAIVDMEDHDLVRQFAAMVPAVVSETPRVDRAVGRKLPLGGVMMRVL